MSKIWSALGILGGVATFGTYKILKKKRTTNSFRTVGLSSNGTANPATYATQLKQAFDNDFAFGFGTDEEAVFQTLEKIPSQAVFKKVQKEFKKLYKKELIEELQSELDTDEYNKAIGIITQKG